MDAGPGRRHAEGTRRTHAAIARGNAGADIRQRIRAGRPCGRRPEEEDGSIAGAAVAAVVLAAATGVKLWSDRAAPDIPSTTVAVTPATTPPAPDRKSIAVLPFQNLSGRAEDAYLADGLQEEILNALARFRDLKVISRTSVMEFRDTTPNVREIGKRLGAGSVLEGSIRRDGNTVRLTVQLIDSRTTVICWPPTTIAS